MPNLTPNTMTVIELEGHNLADLLATIEHGGRPYKLSIMLEVEPDGTIYVKHKVDEGSWSFPYESGPGSSSARVERLYDEPVNDRG